MKHHLFYAVHIPAMTQAVPVPGNTKDKQVRDGWIESHPFCISRSVLHLGLNSWHSRCRINNLSTFEHIQTFFLWEVHSGAAYFSHG